MATRDELKECFRMGKTPIQAEFWAWIDSFFHPKEDTLSIEKVESLQEKLNTINEAIGQKVEKEAGKGLSTNDYTNEDKQKLAGLQNYDDEEIKEEIVTSCGKTLPVVKTTVLQATEFVQDGDKYSYLVLDDNMGVDTLVNVVPANDSLSNYEACKFYLQGFVKSDAPRGFYVYCRTLPTDSINISYSIQKIKE